MTATLTGCAASPELSPYPLPEDDRQIRETDAFVPGPGEGIVLGYGAYFMQREPRGRLYNMHDAARRFVVMNTKGENWMIPVTLARETPVREVSDQGGVVSRPFAFRLPAGRYRVATYQEYGVTGYFNSGYAVTMYYGWVGGPVSPGEFEVRDGEVSYLGRFGIQRGEVAFPDREARDQACGEGRRRDRYDWAKPVWHCTFVNMIADAYPAGLPALMQRYPALNGRPLPSRPINGAPMWRDWTEATMRPM